ncbi:MAG: methyltransferase domain-containing protein [bacterium]
MSLERIRADWTRLGEHDPMWAVLVSPGRRHHRWSPEEFFATGRDEVDAVLARGHVLGLEPELGTALDFGCGVGRLTQALAGCVKRVVGFDVSAPMLAEARRHDVTGRCQFLLDDGRGLARFPDGSFDIAYSSLVLQHIPPPDNQRVLGELIRVLRPGGALFVQVASRPTSSAKGLLFAHAPRAALRAAQRHVLRYPAPMEMHALDRATVESVVADAGGRVRAAVDDEMYGGHWVYTRYFVDKGAGGPA